MNSLEVRVHNVFKFSNGWLIAIIQSREGILNDGTILSNARGERWQILHQQHTTGSMETYEILKEEASKNIYQYRIVGLEHGGLPEKDAPLYIER